MGRKAILGAVLSLALLIAGVSAPPRAEAYHTGTVLPLGRGVNTTLEIARNNWTAFSGRISGGEEVSYDIRVTSGAPIDLLILPPHGFDGFTGHAFQWDGYDSRNQFLAIRGVFRWPSSPNVDVYFVLDNTDWYETEPTGNVTVQVSLTRALVSTTPPWFWLVCGILAVVAFLPGIAILLRRRKKSRAAAPPPPPLPPPPPPDD